jgi:hypothetical protein
MIAVFIDAQAGSQMTKPAQQHFDFDKPMEKERPSRLLSAVDFLFPVLIATAGVAVAYFWT